MIVGALLAAWLSACGPTVENAVATTEHCGVKLIDSTLALRVSRYSAGPGDRVWVAQICNLSGGCTAVASYVGGYAPIVSFPNSEELEVTLPGATQVKPLRESLVVSGLSHRVIVKQGELQSDNDIAKVRQAHGLDPTGRRQNPNCHDALGPKPFYADDYSEPMSK